MSRIAKPLDEIPYTEAWISTVVPMVTAASRGAAQLWSRNPLCDRSRGPAIARSVGSAHLNDRPGLDGDPAQVDTRPGFRDLDRFVDRTGVDHRIAAERLPGLDEWPVRIPETAPGSLPTCGIPYRGKDSSTLYSTSATRGSDIGVATSQHRLQTVTRSVEFCNRLIATAPAGHVDGNPAGQRHVRMFGIRCDLR